MIDLIVYFNDGLVLSTIKADSCKGQTTPFLLNRITWCIIWDINTVL